MTAKKGWWNAAGSATFYKCVHGANCLGGDETSVSSTRMSSGTNRRSSGTNRSSLAYALHNSTNYPEAQCRDGASGILCGVCTDNYVLNGADSCVPCQHGSSLRWVWYGAAIFMLILLVFYIWRSKLVEKRKRAEMEAEMELNKITVTPNALAGSPLGVGAEDVKQDTQALAKQHTEQFGRDMARLAGPLKLFIGCDTLDCDATAA